MEKKKAGNLRNREFFAANRTGSPLIQGFIFNLLIPMSQGFLIQSLILAVIVVGLKCLYFIDLGERRENLYCLGPQVPGLESGVVCDELKSHQKQKQGHAKH